MRTRQVLICISCLAARGAIWCQQTTTAYFYESTRVVVAIAEAERATSFESKGWVKGDYWREDRIGRFEGETFEKRGIRHPGVLYELFVKGKLALRVFDDPSSIEIPLAPHHTLRARLVKRGASKVGTEKIGEEECEIWRFTREVNGYREITRYWIRQSDSLPLRYEEDDYSVETGKLRVCDVVEWRNWRKDVTVADEFFAVPMDFRVKDANARK